MSVTETRGRKPSKGRFDTREELCSFIWRTYLGTKANIADIARQAQVSTTLVSRVLDSGEGKPVDGSAPALSSGLVKPFANTRSMAAWLADPDNLEALKIEYPPARFTATLDLINMRIVVTARKSHEASNRSDA